MPCLGLHWFMGASSLLRTNCPFRWTGNDTPLSRTLSLALSLSTIGICYLAFGIHNFAPCRAAFSGQKQRQRRRPLVIALWQSKSKANCSPCFWASVHWGRSSVRARGKHTERERESALLATFNWKPAFRRTDRIIVRICREIYHMDCSRTFDIHTSTHTQLPHIHTHPYTCPQKLTRIWIIHGFCFVTLIALWRCMCVWAARGLFTHVCASMCVWVLGHRPQVATLQELFAIYWQQRQTDNNKLGDTPDTTRIRHVVRLN